MSRVSVPFATVSVFRILNAAVFSVGTNVHETFQKWNLRHPYPGLDDMVLRVRVLLILD